jgi:hypothetical protein
VSDLNSSAQGGGNCMQNVDHTFDRFHHLGMTVTTYEFAEGLYSLFKNGSDRLDRVTSFDLGGELILYEACPHLHFVLLDGIPQK